MSLDLEAIELCKQLKHRYFRCLDTGDIEGLSATLKPDVSIRYEGATYLAEYSNRDDFLAFIKQSFHADAVAMHNGHHPEIYVNGDEAEGVWYLNDEFFDLKHKVMTRGASIYRDKYVRQADGTWLIAHSGYKRIWELVEKIEGEMSFTYRHLKAQAEAGKTIAV